MAQAITIHIPDTLYDQLKRTAELSQRSIDTIVTHSLSHSIAPLLEDIPAEYQADVYPLLEMDETALQAEARRIFPTDRWSTYEALLAKKKEGRLTEKEHATLDALRREADVLMFRKAYAAVLLKRRGSHPPSIHDLPTVS
jgi:predicted transcriptional regulator